MSPHALHVPLYTDLELVSMVLLALVAPLFIHAVFCALVERTPVLRFIADSFRAELPPIADVFKAPAANDNVPRHA